MTAVAAAAPDTIARERGSYLGRLRADPGFAARQTPAIIAAIGRRLRNRLLLRFRPDHRGLKSRPPWLNLASALRNHPPQSSCLRLPSYTTDEVEHIQAETALSGCAAPQAQVDPEDYFKQHRWSFLLDCVLQGTPDFEDALSSCLRWVEDHPERSDAAWEPYSCSERVANLLICVAVSAGRCPDAAELPARLRTFLDESLAWILRHLEYYGPNRTNNHILNNARALVMGGVATGRPAVIASGMRIFREWLPALVGQGGHLREGSSHYQLVVLNWLLDARAFLALEADDWHADKEYVAGYAGRMAEAADMFCEAGSRLLALIGDISPDASPATSLSRLLRLYPQSWPPISSDSDRIGGSCLRDGWFRLSSEQSIVLGYFPTNEFPPAFPTHCHSDATSFVWLRAGRTLLLDPGRFRYTPDPISVYQKSAAAHNVPLIEGFAPLAEPLVPNGQWWPRPYSEASARATMACGSIELSHDGFARATPVRRHVRTIQLTSRGLEVIDQFEGRGAVEVTFCWHFGQDFESFDLSKRTARGRSGSVVLEFEGVSATPSFRSSYAGACDGWISNAYGSLEAGLVLYVSFRAALPVRVTTRFSVSTEAG